MSQLNDTLKSFDIPEIDRILNSMANEDALKILIAAEVGIENSARIIKELGLTQKRYYAHLKELIKTGLIEKNDEVYCLTAMGKVCYNLSSVFNNALKSREYLNVADALRKSKSISLVGTKQILQALSSKGIIGSIGVADLIEPVKMIERFEELVSELITLIDKAKKSIYLASYYTESHAIEAILRASERGVKISSISPNRKGLLESLQMLRMILNPNIVKLYSAFADGKIRAKLAEFPFSFCVIDERYVIVELPNPVNNDFYLGFSIQNEDLGRRLIETFENLFLEGKENPLMSHIFK